MSLAEYRLRVQLGATAEAVSYRGEVVGDGTPVLIHVFTPGAVEAGHWQALGRRLRLAALLNHPAAVAIHDLALEHDPPYVALEWVEDTPLAGQVRGRLPLPLAEALALARELASVLTAAHRLGLAHGQLGPESVRSRGNAHLKLEFTGIALPVTVDYPPRTSDWQSGPPPRPTGLSREASLDLAADVRALGLLLAWLLTGQSEPADLVTGMAEVDALVRRMRAADPDERPSARVVGECLAALHHQVASASGGVEESQLTAEFDLHAPSVAEEGPGEEEERFRILIPPARPAEADRLLARGRLGRFLLLEKLGQGGMGAVYRGQDQTDDSIVAIKVLRPELLERPQTLRRFHKEARLLAEVSHANVTNLLEVNEDDGIHYLVLEYVAGQSLARLLVESGRLEERTALRILSDVVRALVPAHQRGIVHRDIKPDNILLRIVDCGSRIDEQHESGSLQSAIRNPQSAMVKLSDFGLARHIVESESLNVTQAGAILGTPLYMPPEQACGGAIDQRADIYSLGATLFHMLAGRPPFQADNALGLLTLHATKPPPDLLRLNPAISDGTCQVVNRCLAKSPEERYAGAEELLRDLERLLRGEPTRIALHPALPACDPGNVLEYDLRLGLDATPEQLWPHVSNTERVNRAIGLSAVHYTTAVEADRPEAAAEVSSGTVERSASLPGNAVSVTSARVRRWGQFRKSGISAAWEEHPYEWIAARRMGVLREFTKGPFKWLLSSVELTPKPAGGTTLAHKIRVEAHGLLGRTFAAVEVGIRARRALERVYRRIDAALTGKLGDRALADPFEEPAVLSRAQRRRLDHLLDRLTEQGIDPGVLERLGDFLAQAPAQEVSRIRPLALARRLALDPDQMVAACLHGVREGLFTLLWDILCPVCRIPTEIKDSLKQLREHGRCEACNLDFELDFANSVEMVFRAEEEVRATDLGTYCIGGPAHSPHVVAQVRLAPGERIELELALSEGAYQLRGPQLPFVFDFQVQPGAPAGRCDVSLPREPEPDLSRLLRTGAQLLVLANEHDQELLVRVERTAPRSDALTAARATALALFRRLFSGEVLSAGQLVSVATVTLLVAGLEDAGQLYEELGDARAFALLHEHFRRLDDCIRREGGALIKTVGEEVWAAFHQPVAAVRAGLQIAPLHVQVEGPRSKSRLRPRVGIHRGAALAATLNDHLDYFGTTVKQAAVLAQLGRGGELILTQAVAGDPAVDALLRGRDLPAELFQADLPGQAAAVLQRVGVAPMPDPFSEPQSDSPASR
jgi:serine/threonine protein kinase/class 3 adenylate cyclase